MIWLLYNFIDLLFSLLSLAILAEAVLSWFRINPYHPAVMLLHQITDPILAPLRGIIPPLGMIDITPLVALILLQIIRQILLSSLMGAF